jgi:hypothetical protein
MTSAWRYFLAAVLITVLVLLKLGAPPIAIAVGVGAATLFLWRRTSRIS